MAFKGLFNQAPGAFEFGAITGSYQLLLAIVPVTGTITADKGWARIIYVNNSLNQEVLLSFNGGVTDWLWLPPSQSMVIDLSTSGIVLTESIYVKHNGVAPTSGKIYCNAVRSKA